jgi:hypothetical protein
MHTPQSRMIAVSALAFVLALAAPESSIAQRTKGDEGTGGAAGYSPPVGTGPAADSPAAPEAMPPPPPDAGQAAPAPDAISPDATKPDDGTKKDDGTLPGPDQPD